MPSPAEKMQPARWDGADMRTGPVVTSCEQEFNMKMLLNNMTRFYRDEEGVTAIEYGLIAALIAVVIITAVALVGTNLTAVFDFVAGKLTVPAAP
jgi:pilus assembly protein Flp/PilA